MENFVQTSNEILKFQVDAFLDTSCRILMDSFILISKELSNGTMNLHFKAKEYEAQLKTVSSFKTLYIEKE